MGPARTPPRGLEPGAPFRVAGWEVEPSALTLHRVGEERRLEPRVMALLVCLARHAGRTVTREELRARVWADVVVGDDAIHSAVSKLRRALDSRDSRMPLETLPKTGYRLVAPVERPSARVDEGATTPETAPRSRPRSAASGVTASRLIRDRHRLAWTAAAFLALAGALAWSLGSGRRGSSNSRPAVRPVTAWPGLEVEPALSPADTDDRVAFSWRGPAGDNWDIWIQVPGAGDPLRLTTDPGSDHDPAWSPGGRYLAFVRQHDGRCSVMRIPALGGSERRLAGCSRVEGLTWSPDGRRLLWADRPSPDEPFRIVELDLESGSSRELTRPDPGSVGDLDPEVSPDGRTLAFLRSPVLGVEDIHLLSLAGGAPRRLTRDSLKIHGLAWMPDGRDLVFSSNRGGLFSLWRVSAEGGDPIWLGVAGGDLDAPSIGGSGRRIAYEQWNDDTNIYRLSVAPGATARRVLGSSRWDWAPDVSPDGRRAVFVSDRTGSCELWAASLEHGRAPRVLTDLGGPYVDHPRWSPGGTEIAFDARPGGNADIYLLELGEARARRVTDHPGRDLSPSWSRDGRWIYFASDRSGDWDVWKAPRRGGTPIRVTRSGGYFAQESPDGRWLYFSRRREAGIWRRSAAADDAPVERVLTAHPLPLDRSHWLVAAGSLLFVQRLRPEEAHLARLDLATGRTETLADLGTIPYNSGLALGPSGEWVLYARTDRWESDIHLLEPFG